MRFQGRLLEKRARRLVPVALLLFALGLVLFFPAKLEAYVGPGAGFAVLSSFWALFLAFVYSLLALVTWPLRLIFRLVRGRRAYGQSLVKRIVILGFDGMDPELAEKYMREGKLPHLARLKETGTFRRLQTTFPAISPVAWSTFQTGVNPGKHNIYDFLARDRSSYLPYLSSAQIRNPRRRLRIGKYTVPLGRPQLKLLRRAQPFWHWLGKAGIFCSVIRVPVSFPPERFAGVLLSGMCVPDLKGSQGTFCFFTTRSASEGEHQGGVRIAFEQRGNAFYAEIPGPQNPLQEDQGSELHIPFRVRPDLERDKAEIEIGRQRFSLGLGEYSEWVRVRFKAALGFRAHGICRFHLKQLAPHLEVYVTPVNLDPLRPDLPISHPLTYSIYLAKLLGPYATLGLAEDTWALNEGCLDDNSFLAQCYSNHAERERMFFDALDKTRRGVCICVFDTTDRVQHMFWRYLEGNHPAAKARAASNGSSHVIEDLYRRMDDLVGRVLSRLDDQALLLVLSDHGFKSFARGVNLNTWLHHNGYLALKNGAPQSGEWFHGVDWSRTRAYAMGLNGLYLNQQGRERAGIVPPGAAAEELKQEIRRKLQGLLDHATGRVAIRRVYDSDSVFAGPYRENAPDLIIGYNEGYRAAWDCVTGKVTNTILEDNTRAWSGDHCIDPELVPGVLFSNRKIADDCPAIVDVAPTVLKLLGLHLPPHLDGNPWTIVS